MENTIARKIASLRKTNNMTQEKLAHMLGVSTAAVSKWETGASYPDITLLAPLARALGTNLDTLLAFETHLTDAKVQEISAEIIELSQTAGIPAAEDRMQEYLRLYPNSPALKQQAVALLTLFEMQEQTAAQPVTPAPANTKTAAQQADNAQPSNTPSRLLQKKLLLQDLYESDDPRYRTSAAASLAAIAMQEEDYDTAEHYLDSIPDKQENAAPLKVQLHLRRGANAAALELLQRELFSDLSESYIYLTMLLEHDMLPASNLQHVADNLQQIDRILHGSTDASSILLAKYYVTKGAETTAREYLQTYLASFEKMGASLTINEETFAPTLRNKPADAPSDDLLRQTMMAAILADEDLCRLM